MLSSRWSSTASCRWRRAARLGLEIERLLPALPAEGKPQGQESRSRGPCSPARQEAARARARSSSTDRSLTTPPAGNAASASITSSAPCPWPLGDLIVMGHTLVHFGQFFAQLPGGAVVHHQHRGGAEGPAAAVAQGDGGAAHLAAGAAVEAAHLGDVVVEQRSSG